MSAGTNDIDLSYLLPASQQVALLPNEDRLKRIRAERWIGYPKAVEALDKLETLLAWPIKQRMPNLLIIGPTNNGKSMIIEKFRRAHPIIPGLDSDKIPIVTVQMPSDPSIHRFYAALLAAIGAPIPLRRRLAEMEQHVLGLLRAVNIRMLIIDELHNLLSGSNKQQREFLNLLRFLGNELHVPLVGVGTKDAYLAIRTDDQLENRFEPLTLPLWQEGKNFESLLASFVAVLPLRRPSLIANADMTRYLLARTEGTIGEIAQLLMAAASDLATIKLTHRSRRLCIIVTQLRNKNEPTKNEKLR